MQHTSASLAINENADPDVRGDMERWFRHNIRDKPYYVHTYEGLDDMPAHIKSVLVGPSLSISWPDDCNSAPGKASIEANTATWRLTSHSDFTGRVSTPVCRYLRLCMCRILILLLLSWHVTTAAASWEPTRKGIKTKKNGSSAFAKVSTIVSYIKVFARRTSPPSTTAEHCRTAQSPSGPDRSSVY